MNWEKFAFDTLHQMISWGGAVCSTLGIGGGVGLVKLLNHWPAPRAENIYTCAVFDTAQDLATNKRIGERRTSEGVAVPAVPKMDPIPDPKPGIVDPVTRP